MYYRRRRPKEAFETLMKEDGTRMTEREFIHWAAEHIKPPHREKHKLIAVDGSEIDIWLPSDDEIESEV